MEEDIKKSIEFIEDIEGCGLTDCSYNKELQCDLLKNTLLKLEEENKELKAITQAYNSYSLDSNSETKILIADSRYFDSGFFIEKFVTKEKIKGKIEELRKKESLFSANKQGYNLAMVQYQIQVLQELL